MTKSDVVDEFIRGDIDRRGFIRKLTAVGVSSGAAMAYAGSLVQNAAATPSRHGAGFITRAQDPDDEYGPAIPIEDIQEAIDALVETVQAIVDALNQFFEDFDAGDFVDAGLEESDFELVGDIQSQIEQQVEALNSILDSLFGARPTSRVINGFRSPTSASLVQASDSVLARLAEVANGLNNSAGMYAAIIPAIEDVEDRQVMTQIGIVTGRHAAVVSYLADVNPVPNSFEQPIDPATVG